MNKKSAIYLIGIILLLSASVFADNRYEVGGFDDDTKIEKFVNDFKQAVKDQDKAKVASMIEYPVKATFGKRKVVMRSENEFIARYNDIFDKELKAKIAGADTKDMFTNYQGVMIGDGDVWFGGGDNPKVIAVGICRLYDDPDIK